MCLDSNAKSSTNEAARLSITCRSPDPRFWSGRPFGMWPARDVPHSADISEARRRTNERSPATSSNFMRHAHNISSVCQTLYPLHQATLCQLTQIFTREIANSTCRLRGDRKWFARVACSTNAIAGWRTCVHASMLLRRHPSQSPDRDPAKSFDDSAPQFNFDDTTSCLGIVSSLAHLLSRISTAAACFRLPSTIDMGEMRRNGGEHENAHRACPG